MPSEVYAEDLEALLERLDGVAAARVVATDAGEIDRVYITAEGDEDEPAIRRSVGSALMSGYSLAVDPWRIRVARLRPAGPTRPRWFMQRVEEILTATDVRVSVELRAAEGPTAALIGRARGPLDAASRLRAAAQATLDALKAWLEADDRRAAVETISLLPLATGRAIVVVLSLAGPASADRYIGAAIVEGSEAEAVIAATLDALGKRGTALQRRGWMMRDRQDELESMEAHFRRLREPQRVMPQLARAPALPANGPAEYAGPAEDAGPTEDGGSAEDARPAERVPVETFHPRIEPRIPGQPMPGPRIPEPRIQEQPAVDSGEVAPERDDEDEVATLEQIRPERPGGAEVAQPMNRPEIERGRFSPKSSMEDEFIKHLMATGTPIHIRCRDGYEITDGIVRDFGTYSLLVETRGGRELVFKHGIISIRPLGAGGR
jgi:sRNA-binding regulator protein Hfq